MGGCRSEKKANKAVEDLVKESGLKETDRLKLVLMDLGDLETIQNVPRKLKELGVNKLDCLICNAGIMCPPNYRETKQGFESQWGINHLGHYYLTNVLEPFLNESEDKRVVILSSISQYWCNMPPAGEGKKLIYPASKEEYNPEESYGWSKICNLLTVQELSKNLNISSYAVHPGWIYDSALADSMNHPCPCCACCCSIKTANTNVAMCVKWCFCDYNVKTLEQSAATSLVCAVQDQGKLTDGAYYQCANRAPTRADIPDVAADLWAYSAEEIQKFEAGGTN